jgi:hypothetical protein
MTLIKDLDTDEFPFINAKIGGNLIDFEHSVDSETSFSNWALNVARGVIGENSISKNANITMMWETGQAAIAEAESKTCNFNQSECFQAKSLPVIFDTDYKIGYTTGGQNVTVTGYGFDHGTIKAEFDGVPCEVTSFTRT